MTGEELMTRALNMKNKLGVTRAVKFLENYGINPDFALLALVGVSSAKHYGADMENVSVRLRAETAERKRRGVVGENAVPPKRRLRLVSSE